MRTSIARALILPVCVQDRAPRIDVQRRAETLRQVLQRDLLAVERAGAAHERRLARGDFAAHFESGEGAVGFAPGETAPAAGAVADAGGGLAFCFGAAASFGALGRYNGPLTPQPPADAAQTTIPMIAALIAANRT